MLKWIAAVAWLLALAVLAGFAYLNAEPVSVEFHFTSVSLPLALLLGAVFALGIVLSALIFLPRALSRARRIRRLDRQLRAATGELERQRGHPLRERR